MEAEELRICMEIKNSKVGPMGAGDNNMAYDRGYIQVLNTPSTMSWSMESKQQLHM
jgi:hypothetical protein